jgi:signal transduction histidine kinase
MKRCVAGLSKLLSDLLDLSKLDAGVIVPKVCDFSLDSVLGKVISAMEPKARRKRLALRHRYGGCFGSTDPVLFRRIVGNLVSNAIRYTERGGVLSGCRRREGRLWVEVWDTGVGIPADKTAEIFEEFNQLGNNDLNREQGTGIGLTIVSKEAAPLGLRVGSGKLIQGYFTTDFRAAGLHPGNGNGPYYGTTYCPSWRGRD